MEAGVCALTKGVTLENQKPGSNSARLLQRWVPGNASEPRAPPATSVGQAAKPLTYWPRPAKTAAWPELGRNQAGTPRVALWSQDGSDLS